MSAELMTADELARAKVLTTAAATASDVADEYRARAASETGMERERLLAKAAGAVTVMARLIEMAQ